MGKIKFEPHQKQRVLIKKREKKSVWIFNNLLHKQGFSNLCRRRPNAAHIEFLKISIRADFGTLTTLYRTHFGPDRNF